MPKKQKQLTAQQLMDVVKEYNKAREMELSTTGGVVAEGYKNPFMDNLHRAAAKAAKKLDVDFLN